MRGTNNAAHFLSCKFAYFRKKLYLCASFAQKENNMKPERKTPIVLTKEQEQFFIETWENNQSYSATIIIREKLGLALDVIGTYAKQLRAQGKIRDKKKQRFSENEIAAYKTDYENGLTLNEIADKHHRGSKAIRRYLIVAFGGKLPKVDKRSIDGEKWADIENCDTHQVSDKGRIYVKATNQIIYGHLAHGYRYVYITDNNGIKHHYAVHRLVAQAFIPNPENKSEVDHIDSNPANNDVTNLRWVNHEEQYRNEETIKKKQLGQERQQRRWKIKPLLDKIFEIEPDKIELIKMIIEYKS